MIYVNKNFTVQEFVNQYNQTTEQMRPSFLDTHLMVEDYIGFNRKMTLAYTIVKNSTYATEPVMEDGQVVKDENGDVKYHQTNRIQVNSCTRYILFVFTVIQTYTNINMDHAKMLDEFDLLNKEGLIEKIFEMIPKKEIDEMNKVVEKTYDDFMTNYYETHSFIANQVQRATAVLSVVLKPLAEKISAMDKKEIQKSVDKILKFADRRMSKN